MHNPNEIPDEPGALNLCWSYNLIDGLIAAGATTAIISPGSRSTPLVLACERHPGIRIHTLIDERCAGFFGLGQTLGEKRPTILIATSGSAPAHWLPAVMEAHHSRLPLILLSADRPPELQGRGANQTTEQSNLFRAFTRVFCNPGMPRTGNSGLKFIQSEGIRLGQRSLWPHPGPVHINLPLREPLVPKHWPVLPQASQPALQGIPGLLPDPIQLTRLRNTIAGRPGLIVCGPGDYGDDFTHQVTSLAGRLNCPLMADPLSGMRFGKLDKEQILSRYDTFLRHPGVPTPEWVLRFGAPPISKPLLSYLANSGDDQILCDPWGQWPDGGHLIREMVRASPSRLCQQLMELVPDPDPGNWFDLLSKAEQIAHSEALQSPPLEGKIISELLDELPDGSQLFCGNSMPIRHLDSWSGSGSKSIRLLANRGISGIDGAVSTLLGLAVKSKGKTVGLLGDLTFYHDMNGLLAARDLDAVIIVLNNNGGGIFGYLPQADLDSFEPHWVTPTGLDFSQVATLYNLSHTRVKNPSEFKPALRAALAKPGVDLIEVISDRNTSIAAHKSYWKRVVSGLIHFPSLNATAP
ncbi:MAG: 2-succinyl-5-enolpyruvyl-6-hydroxy-3-cyclohexene-1-carboxylic-acid synthase [Gammaproteobacteria bacterium]|nr:2-succinyl-5-enolpyruvyl-6-hydroxy-3-cyclohexene-1-carboxylic-acid synthase [Gammaproteobacteria bacterium]